MFKHTLQDLEDNKVQSLELGITELGLTELLPPIQILLLFDSHSTQMMILRNMKL